MRLACLLLALPLLGAAPPQAPIPITVALSSFRFDPATIRLAAGQPYVLRLVNRSGSGHNFVAPEFFAAARTGATKVDMPGGRTVELAITAPARGTYKVKCTRFGHAMMGMKGEIVVE